MFFALFFQLVWYILVLKQLFTSVSVKVVDIHHCSPPRQCIIVKAFVHFFCIAFINTFTLLQLVNKELLSRKVSNTANIIIIIIMIITIIRHVIAHVTGNDQ